jgi:hypothetical protein
MKYSIPRKYKTTILFKYFPPNKNFVKEKMSKSIFSSISKSDDLDDIIYFEKTEEKMNELNNINKNINNSKEKEIVIKTEIKETKPIKIDSFELIKNINLEKNNE